MTKYMYNSSHSKLQAAASVAVTMKTVYIFLNFSLFPATDHITQGSPIHRPQNSTVPMHRLLGTRPQSR